MSLLETDDDEMTNIVTDNRQSEEYDIDNNLQPTPSLTSFVQYYKTNKGGTTRTNPLQRLKSPSYAIFTDESHLSTGRQTQLPPGLDEDLTVDFTIDIIGTMRDIKEMTPVGFTKLDRIKSPSQRILDDRPEDYILNRVTLDCTYNTFFGCGITMSGTIPVTHACSLNSSYDEFYKADTSLPIPDALIRPKTEGPPQTIELFNLVSASDYYNTDEFKVRHESVIPTTNLRQDWLKVSLPTPTEAALVTFYTACVVPFLHDTHPDRSGRLSAKSAKFMKEQWQYCVSMIGNRAASIIVEVDWSKVQFENLSSLQSFLALVSPRLLKVKPVIRLACLETVMGMKLFWQIIWGHIENHLNKLVGSEISSSDDDNNDDDYDREEGTSRDNKDFSIDNHHAQIAHLFLANSANCSFYMDDNVWNRCVQMYVKKNGALNEAQQGYLEDIIQRHNMSAGSDLLHRVNAGLVNETLKFSQIHTDQDQDQDSKSPIFYNQVIHKIYQKSNRLALDPEWMSNGFIWATQDVIDKLVKLNVHMSATSPQRPPREIKCRLIILPSSQIDDTDEQKYTFQGKLSATYMRKPNHD